MKIQTTRFGELIVPAESIVSFQAGLPGFPRYKRYALFPYQENSPFHILQSVSNPDLTFLAADPYRFFDGYIFEVDDALAVGLGFSDDNRPTVYSVVTLRDTIENATINLLGPLLINWRDHVGAQITLHDTNYSARQALFPEGLPLDKKRSRVVAAVPAHQAAVDMRREAIG